MIQKLKRRLTFLMAALTSLVLGGALIVTWNLSQKQFETSAEALFDSNFSSMCDRLSDTATVTDVWLSEQELGTGCLLFLQDNGSALHYTGSLPSESPRSELESLALEGAELFLDRSNLDQNGAVIQQEAHYNLGGSGGDFYHCAAALLPRGTQGEYLLLVMMQEQGFLTRHMLWSALQYIGLWLAGSALLALISYWLVGKALAPTAQALRQQKEFIAAASHELRSPLAVVKTSLQALDETQPPERQQQLLRNAQSETDRMARLTDDLLLLANGDLGNLPTHLEAVAPDNLCIELYDQFYLLARQASHGLTLTLPDTAVPAIQADAGRLKQLLAILLNNAMEHTPAGTGIELVLCGDGAKAPITFLVVDHGHGISNEDKAHIFDRFYRADTSRTSKRNFGLGLSVARELARLHHATLTVEDTPGGGATFRLQFNSERK